jgi:magnesium transporter
MTMLPAKVGGIFIWRVIFISREVGEVRVFDYAAGKILEDGNIPESVWSSPELFVFCRPMEVPALRNIFGFDESTVRECTNLDETIRYAAFEGYDFISLVHMELTDGDSTPALREINLYISGRYMVLVMPKCDNRRFSQLESQVLAAAENMGERTGRVRRLYFLLCQNLLADFSDLLEILEDQMEALAEVIMEHTDKQQLVDAGNLRKTAYTARKLLRALSYVSARILMDENVLLDKKQLRYFRSVDSRLRKLHDFAESLYELGSGLIHTWDSRMTLRLNDTVNKLTVITLFFAPLTVITGIYGMNFDVMPELRWRFGYPMVLGGMGLICFSLYQVLKKKNWL